MKKIYSHIGKLFDSPEAIICEVVRVLESRIKCRTQHTANAVPAYAQKIAKVSLWDLAYSDAEGAISGLLLISEVFNINRPGLWNMTYSEARKIALEYDGSFAASPLLQIRRTYCPLEAASLWYWTDPSEVGSFLGGYYKYGMRPADFPVYWNEHFTRFDIK